MALLIVSGLPSSGRTTRCEELIEYFQSRIASESSAGPSSSSSTSLPQRIVHLTDANIHLPKSTYSSQRTEKPARASYLSLVSRNLTKDSIIIADGGAGLNIKGFRYQLWCAAREVGLACISVFVSTSPDQCRQWNTKRREAGLEAYDEDTISDLFMRFEEPNAMTRWDSPLFVIPNDRIVAASGAAEPTQATTRDGFKKQPWEKAPLEQLWTAVTSGKITKAPNVVAQNRTTSTNYLSLLESSTQALVATILSHYSSSTTSSASASSSSTLLLSPHANFKVTIDMPQDKKPPTAPQLQRLRRQFVKIHSTSFATGNILGKEAKDEGAGSSGSRTDDAEANLSPEEKIMKRFTVWLGEILHAQP